MLIQSNYCGIIFYSWGRGGRAMYVGMGSLGCKFFGKSYPRKPPTLVNYEQYTFHLFTYLFRVSFIHLIQYKVNIFTEFITGATTFSTHASLSNQLDVCVYLTGISPNLYMYVVNDMHEKTV